MAMGAIVVNPRPNPWAQTVQDLAGDLTNVINQKYKSSDMELLAQTPPDKLAEIMPQLKTSEGKEAAMKLIMQRNQASAEVPMYDAAGNQKGMVRKDAHFLPASSTTPHGITQYVSPDGKQTAQLAYGDPRVEQYAAAGWKPMQLVEANQRIQESSRHNKEMEGLGRTRIDEKNPTDAALAFKAARVGTPSEQEGDKEAAAGLEKLQKSRIDLAGGKAKAANEAKIQALTPYDWELAKMVSSGQMAPQELSKRSQNYNGILGAAKQLNPDFNPQKADMDFAAGKTSSFRKNYISLKSMPDILSKTVEAGKKVNYDGPKFVGMVEKWYKGQVNDPDFVKYMTLRNDALLSIASVMRGTGATDQAHQVEMEAMHPTLPPSALDAWASGQTESLRPRLQEYSKIYGDTVYLSPQAVGEAFRKGEIKDEAKAKAILKEQFGME